MIELTGQPTAHSLCLLVILSTVFRDLSAVRILEVKVPSQVQSGESVTLTCVFDLEGQSLYSLNWWRNNDQFYQFDPAEGKQQIVYETHGIDVNERESSIGEVRLRNVSKDTEGDFKCELVADYPTYERDSAIAPMEVTTVPSSSPEIHLGKTRYKIGDHLKANCTAEALDLPPTIIWYLNGKQINSKHVKQLFPHSSRTFKEHHHKNHHKEHHHKNHRKKKRSHKSANKLKPIHPSDSKLTIDGDFYNKLEGALSYKLHSNSDPFLNSDPINHKSNHHIGLNHQIKREVNHSSKPGDVNHHGVDHVTSHVFLKLRKADFIPNGKVLLTCSAIYSGVFSKSTKVDVSRLQTQAVKPSLRVSDAAASHLPEASLLFYSLLLIITK